VVGAGAGAAGAGAGAGAAALGASVFGASVLPQAAKPIETIAARRIDLFISTSLEKIFDQKFLIGFCGFTRCKAATSKGKATSIA
jgi:hypothetical protein